jgi:vitamin B12 transporter
MRFDLCFGGRRFCAAAAVGVLLGVGGGATARAQETTTPNDDVDAAVAKAPSAEQSSVTAPVYGETTVVTATAVAEERHDVPATVRVVDGAEATARQAESVVELLATVPGAQVSAYGPSGQLGSLYVRGADSNQTLVLWNGIPLNDPFSDEFNFAFLAAEDVARVEVVPGPFSALYGSSAMGGVVQVITESRRGVRAQLEAGQHDHRRATLSAGADRGPLHGELAGHRREGKGGTGNDEYESSEASARLRWAGTSSEASLLLRGNDSETGIPFVGFTPSPLRHIAWREREAALPWTYTATAWELSGMVSQLRYDNEFRDPDDPFGFTRGDTDSRADRARAVATRRFGSGWWAGGADWQRVRVTDSGSFGTSLDDARQRTTAAFTELHLERGRLAADLGVRRDENDAYGGATSPRLGVVVAATPELRLRGSYGEAFRAPALVELYYPFTGNPDLRPEYGRTGELGIAWQRGAWSVDVAAFDSRQRDLITYDFVASKNANVGQASSRGWDGEVRFQRGIVELRLGGMRLDAEDRDSGAPLRNRPRESAHLVAIVRPGSWVLSGVGSWVGERVNAFPEFPYADTVNPGYATLDLAASWQLSSRIAPYARVQNALDREYEAVLGFPTSGRTVIGGVRLEW